MNIATRFQHRINEQTAETAIIEPRNTEVTYTGLDRQIRQVAAWVDEQGFGEDDQIAVYLPDTASYLPVLIGIWRAGAVASPINTRFGLDELEYTLSDLKPSALIGSDVFADNISHLQDSVSGLNEETTLLAEKDGAFVSDDLPAADSAPAIARKLDDDSAVVMYTSGTTGHPKGVIQTHRNVEAQLDVNITHFDIDRDNISLVSVPLFHVGGLYGSALPTLLEGATMVVQPGWDAEEWAKLVETYGVTYNGLIPTMMIDALNTAVAKDRDTSTLELVAYGGSPAAEETLDSFQTVFGINDLRSYYGQTENTGLSVTYDASTERQPGLTGRPVNAVDYRIVDITADDLVDVDRNEEGELLLQGDITTPGYWDESLNDDYFTNGWLHTDDMFVEREDGLLYYVDRVDDMIISGGENVAPTEVENALQDHPAVDAVAVFGTDHERWGETVTAAIVSSNSNLTTNDIETWWQEYVELAGYKRPRRVKIVEELPRTATQKIDKVTLKEILSLD